MAETLTGSLPTIATIQVSTAGTDLNGTAPGTTPTVAARVATYPAHATNNGLFDFGGDMTVIDQIEVHLTGGSAYTIALQSATGRNCTIQSASGLSVVGVVVKGPFYLTANEKLRVTTTGAAGAEVAYAKVTHRKWARKEGF